MDTQKERFREDEDNISDKATDVARSQNREGAAAANKGANISNDVVGGGDGHHDSEETGSHQEGQYDKDSQ